MSNVTSDYVPPRTKKRAWAVLDFSTRVKKSDTPRWICQKRLAHLPKPGLCLLMRNGKGRNRHTNRPATENLSSKKLFAVLGLCFAPPQPPSNHRFASCWQMNAFVRSAKAKTRTKIPLRSYFWVITLTFCFVLGTRAADWGKGERTNAFICQRNPDCWFLATLVPNFPGGFPRFPLISPKLSWVFLGSPWIFPELDRPRAQLRLKLDAEQGVGSSAYPSCSDYPSCPILATLRVRAPLSLRAF